MEQDRVLGSPVRLPFFLVWGVRLLRQAALEVACWCSEQRVSLHTIGRLY